MVEPACRKNRNHAVRAVGGKGGGLENGGGRNIAAFEIIDPAKSAGGQDFGCDLDFNVRQIICGYFPGDLEELADVGLFRPADDKQFGWSGEVVKERAKRAADEFRAAANHPALRIAIGNLPGRKRRFPEIGNDWPNNHACCWRKFTKLLRRARRCSQNRRRNDGRARGRYAFAAAAAKRRSAATSPRRRARERS